MTTATFTSPGQQEIIDILKASNKGMTSREIFAKAKGFEDADAVSKALNYAMKKSIVEREKVAQNTYAYWLASNTPTAPGLKAVEEYLSNVRPSNVDHGNTLLRGTDGSEEPIPAPVKAVINDALKPCPEIDAVTQEMADQAEQAYEALAAALSLTPNELCELQLVDLSELVVNSLKNEIKNRMQAQEALGNGLNQIRRALDINTGTTLSEIVAECENLSRLTQRIADAPQGPYLVITSHIGEPLACLDKAKKRAENIALSSTAGSAAIVRAVAEVEMKPVWSDAP